MITRERGAYRTAEAGTRNQYVQYVGPWAQAALRVRYVPNAGGWHARSLYVPYGGAGVVTSVRVSSAGDVEREQARSVLVRARAEREALQVRLRGVRGAHVQIELRSRRYSRGRVQIELRSRRPSRDRAEIVRTWPGALVRRCRLGPLLGLLGLGLG